MIIQNYSVLAKDPHIAKGLKMSSLAALISMALAPIAVWWFWPSTELIAMQILITFLLFWRHRRNIQNLLSGEESKIGKTS